MKIIGVILAGGRSRRMGGVDKAGINVGGRRMIDYVFDRLRRQVDEIIISGSQDYGLGLRAIPDAPGVVGGPAGGIISVAAWLASNRREISGFLTVPVDGPFLPADFANRMQSDTGAVAADENGIHPTFAWWPVSELAALQTAYSPDEKLSLKSLASALGARFVFWDSQDCFVNLNTPDDITASETRITDIEGS